METEQLKAAANDKLRESETRAKQVFYNRESPTKPGFPSDPAVGCGSSCLTLLIAFVPLGYLLGFLGFGIFTPGMLLVFSVLFGFLGIPAILRIKWQKKCEAIDLKTQAESERLLLEAKDEQTNDLAVIERHMPNNIKARATEQTDAEALFRKARDASAIVLAH